MVNPKQIHLSAVPAQAGTTKIQNEIMVLRFGFTILILFWI